MRPRASQTLLVGSVAAILLAAPFAPPSSAAPSLGARTASTDAERVARAREYVERLADFGFSGQIVVEEHGIVAIRQASGWADREFGVPMTDTTQLAIGSVTKMFVAASILRLESRGRLSTRDSLGKWFPGAPADKAGIRLHDLLTHTSGLRRNVAVPDSSARDDEARRILAAPLAAPPRTRFGYSNDGYDLLAAIVEKAAGEPFGAWLAREFLTPAGLRHTGVARALDPTTTTAARGYNEWREVAAWTEWPERWHRTGSGSIVSTASDLCRWMRGLQDSTLVSGAEARRMFTPYAMDTDSTWYGYGCFLRRLPGGTWLRYHGGDVPGYRAELRDDVDHDRIIVVMTNGDLFGLGVQRRVIASHLEAILRGDSVATPPEAAPDAPDAFAAWQGEYRLPSGGTIDLAELGGTPMLAARGQDAADLFVPPPRAVTPLDTATRRVATLVGALVRGDSAAAAAVLDSTERAFALGFLRGALASDRAAFGEPLGVDVLGSAYMPWSDQEVRTWVRVRFADQPVGFYLGRDGGTLNDITFGEDRPAPILLPVVELLDGTLGAFDVFSGVTVHLARRGRGADAVLVIPGRGGPLEAKRVR